MARRNSQRVHIDLPPAAMERLRKLMQEIEASSYGEVVRQALLTYEEALAKRRQLIQVEVPSK